MAMIAVTIAIAIFHTLTYHKFYDLIVIPGIVALVIIIIYIVVLVFRKYYIHSKPTFPAISSVIFNSYLIIWFSFIYYIIWIAIVDAYYWVQNPSISKDFVGPLIVICLLLIGLLFFMIRLRLRCVYGFTEALVGVIVATQRISPIKQGSVLLDSNLLLAILTAGLYLIVRGYDNIHQGISKPPFDPVASYIMAQFRSKEKIIDEISKENPEDSGRLGDVAR